MQYLGISVYRMLRHPWLVLPTKRAAVDREQLGSKRVLKGTNKPKDEAIPAESIAAITRCNHLDAELYAFGRQLYEEQQRLEPYPKPMQKLKPQLGVVRKSELR